MKLACRNNGGLLTLAEWGEVESVGMVELVCVGRLLRMGCDSFVPGSRMGYHGNILLRTNGGRRGRD